MLDTESTETMNANFATFADSLALQTPDFDAYASCCIISREGSAGQHLRSTSPIVKTGEYPNPSTIAASKEPAIRSYMAAGANSDWPEESVQG